MVPLTDEEGPFDDEQLLTTTDAADLLEAFQRLSTPSADIGS
jgi:hypothetical protein